MVDPAPKPIADCPNPECKIPAKLRVYRDRGEVSDGDRYRVIHDYCGYSGPYASSNEEAIRLHNLIGRPQQSAEPVGTGWPQSVLSDHTHVTRQLDTQSSAQAASPGPSELVEEMEKLYKQVMEVASSKIMKSTSQTKLDKGYELATRANYRDFADELSALITRHRGKS